MIQPVTYTDYKGRTISLAELDDEERKLIARLRRRAKTHPDWNDFDNYWTRAVAEFYDGRGVPRTESRKTAAYRIAQDLSSRIAVSQGYARLGDYRDELAALIRKHFPTRRAFCEATGLSEDMLSHVLARRKHLAIDTLTDALSRIGYTLRIEPLEVVEKAG
jgi:hypothetical protein